MDLAEDSPPTTTFSNPLDLVSATLRDFRGHSRIVCFRQMIDLAKAQYSFDWSVELIALSLFESAEFELQKLLDPTSGEVKWFVHDNRF